MPKRVLIVGGDGLLGRAVADRLSSGRTEVIRTTRRRVGEGLHLELSADPSTWPGLPDVDAVIIAGGVSSLVECAREPEKSARVNVDGIVEVARRSGGMNVQTIYLSSSQVFSGDRPFSRRDDAPSPVSEYGRQKAEAESRIMNLGGRNAVLRISKVMAPDWTLLQNWRTELSRDRILQPFDDFTLAPVRVADVVDLIGEMLKHAATGIYQLSGDADIPYADLARSLAGSMGASADLVQPQSGDPKAAGFESLPQFSSLDMEIESKSFGMHAPRSLDVIVEVIAAVTAD